MNKHIIENIIKVNYNKINFKIIPDVIDIFFNIFITTDTYDLRTIADIIGTILLSEHNSIKMYQIFLCYCYAYAKTNYFLDDINKLHKVIYNLKSLRLDQLEKYFVPFINKPNSYGIDKILDHLFCSYRNYKNNKVDNKIFKIIIDLSKINLTEEIINVFDLLVHKICFSDNIIDYTPLVVDFYHTYLVKTKN